MGPWAKNVVFFNFVGKKCIGIFGVKNLFFKVLINTFKEKKEPHFGLPAPLRVSSDGSHGGPIVLKHQKMHSPLQKTSIHFLSTKLNEE